MSADQSEPLSFDERVQVMKRFMASVGPDESAKFTVRLQDAVTGQLENINAYQREFRKLYEQANK